MEIQALHDEKTIVAFPQDELRMDTCERIGDRLENLLKGKASNLIVDLSDTVHLDSAGIGVLLRVMQVARGARKLFVLANPHPNVRRVFRISNLHKIFDIQRTVEDALFTLEAHRVLIWESRPAVIEFYEEVLGASGFVVLTTESGEETRNALRNENPCVLLLDVLEHEEEKLALVKEIRRDKGIPVVVISTYLEEETPFIEAGADIFLSKPFRVENLVLALKDLVRPRGT